MKMKPFLSLALAALAFVGCDDNDNTNDVPLQNNARVLVVHAVPDAPPVNLVVNNNTTSPAATGLAFGSNTGYLNVNTAPSPTNVKVIVPSLSNATVINADVPLQTGTNYTTFATGRASGTPAIGAIVVTDNLAAPAANQAHVRFFHLAPGAPTVDIFAFPAGTTQPTAPTFDARSFETQATAATNQNFTPVAAGTYTVNVRTDAAPNTLVLSVPNVNLQAGKIYTIYAQGIVGGTGAQALGAGVITHN